VEVEDFGGVIKSIVPDDYEKPGDYRDAEGFLVCGNCHTRKETLFYMPAIGKSPAEVIKVPCACECENKAWEERHAQQLMRERKLYIEQLRREGMMDVLRTWDTFENDDDRNPEATLLCAQYVEKWDEMLRDNIGILFTGGVGTGKTFYAGCIANALTEKLVSVGATSLPKMINKLQTFPEERVRALDALQRYEFLVLDDLGVERDTSYAAEQTYLIIDTRYRANKPLIITTNLSVRELETPQNLTQERIYDRILEMCPLVVELTGKSRRRQNIAVKQQKALEQLWWDKNEV